MVLDAVANFVRGATDASVDNSQTTVSVDDASIFPDPSTDGEFNVVVWDASNFPRPDQDPDVEIMRVTAVDTGANDLTVTRGQEMTSAAAHPSESAIHLTPTAKMFGDIDSQKLGDGDDFNGQGTSDFSNLQSVGADEVNSKIDIKQGDDLNNRLDEFDRRNVLANFHDDLTLSQTVDAGPHTVFEGETADMVDGPATTFDPRPTLTWGADVNAFETPGDAAYRIHKPEWRHITIVGSNDAGGQAGINLLSNTNNDTVGAFLDNVYVENTQYGVDGNTDNAMRAEQCHFQKCQFGVRGLNHGWIDQCVFWRFTNGGGYAVEVGPQTHVTDSRFEMGGGTGAATDVGGVRVFGTAGGVDISGNYFKYDMSDIISFDSATVQAVKVRGNTFDGVFDRAVNGAGRSGSQYIATNNVVNGEFNTRIFSTSDECVIAFNDMADATPNSTNCIFLLGNDNWVVGNSFPGGATDSVQVRGERNFLWGTFPSGITVDSQSTDTYIYGPLTWSDVSDSGTRTVINDLGLNNGDPSSTGDWNGNGYEGLQVRDTANNNTYLYNNGTWSQIAST